MSTTNWISYMKEGDGIPKFFTLRDVEEKLANINKKLAIKLYTFMLKLRLCEEAIEKEVTLNILCNMTNFDGMEIKAAWRDFRFGMRHIRDFHRCALVGASKWVEWCVKLTVSFFKFEVRLFQTGQEKEARNWLTD